MVCDVFEVKEQITFLEARNEVVHAYLSHDKVHQYFGNLTKNITLKECTNRMVRDAKGKGPRQGTKFKYIEVENNMPPIWKKSV